MTGYTCLHRYPPHLSVTHSHTPTTSPLFPFAPLRWMTGYTCLHRYPPNPSLTMPTKRTYSGSRIRITDFQAHLIALMIDTATEHKVFPNDFHYRCAIRDLHLKTMAQATRHKVQEARLWPTTAASHKPGTKDVGHNAGIPGHDTGSTGSTAVTAAGPAGPGSSLDTSEITSH